MSALATTGHTSTADGVAVLEASGIKKNFGRIRALRDASLTLRAGTVTALVGDNGAGKSTLVRILTGAMQPDEGSIRLGGEPVHFQDSRRAAEQGIHTVFQDLALVDTMTVTDNMFLCDEVHRRVLGIKTPWLDHAEMHRQAHASLRDLGVTTVQDVTVRIEALSGGQRQVVSIARAVRHKAKVVILDEPTAALGVSQAEHVLELVKRLRVAGTAVLVISHNLREVFAVSDYVAVMRLGEVVRVFETDKTTETEVVSSIVGAA
jgi:ABC-type sugar transport system ATPase subunit